MKTIGQIGQISLITIASFLLSSCAIFAPSERDLSHKLPPRFSLYTEEQPDLINRWWESFSSSELNELIEKALTNSPSIQQAWARLEQADAIAQKAGAGRLPTLNYNADGSARKKDYQTGFSPGIDSFNSYSLGLSASYEVDLWGRVKSQTQAAAFDRAASREDLNTAAITLASRVALTWTGILAQQLQNDVLRRQLEANQTTEELIELRFRKSLSSALDVYQQRQTVASTESQLPKAELREKILLNELAVLLGETDFNAISITKGKLPVPGKLPGIGIPAEVLAGRPDVRKAGLQLQSADWQVSAAKADRLPAIRLSGSATYGNSDIDVADIFDNWAANLAASITGPIFEGGRRKAEVARAHAVANERMANYKQVVLNAIKEVEDALVSEEKQQSYITLLDQRLEAAQRSHEESVNRYRNGLIEYTTVLRQLNALQNLERERVSAQYELLQYRINLYRALGGSWPSELVLMKHEEK